MAERDTRSVTIEELLVSSVAQTDALAKRLIKKELITREEFAEDCRGTDNVSKAPKSPNERRCRHRRRTMRCRLAKPTGQLMWRIWALALIISIVFVFGSTAVFARGGGHSGGGHAGGHSGGRGSHSGGHEGHHGDHTGGKHGFIRSGATAGSNFMDQHRCPSIHKNLADCPEFGETQWQTNPAEKTGNRFESRFE